MATLFGGKLLLFDTEKYARLLDFVLLVCSGSLRRYGLPISSHLLSKSTLLPLVMLRSGVFILFVPLYPLSVMLAAMQSH